MSTAAGPASRPDEDEVIEHISIDLPPLYSDDDQDDQEDAPMEDAEALALAATSAHAPAATGLTPEFEYLHSQLQILAQSRRMHHRVLAIEDTRVVRYTARVVPEELMTNEVAPPALPTHTSNPANASPSAAPATAVSAIASTPVAASASCRPLVALPAHLDLSSFAILQALVDTSHHVFESDTVLDEFFGQEDGSLKPTTLTALAC